MPDVADIKKLLQVLKGQKVEGKIVSARESLKDRDLIVNAANEPKPTKEKISREDQAFADLLQAGDEQNLSADEYFKLYDAFDFGKKKDLGNVKTITDSRNAEEVENLSRSFSLKGTTQDAVLKHAGTLSDNAPVHVVNPFKPEEKFQFPPGTDETKAKEMVREILLRRARSGEMKITLPSSLKDEEPPLKE